MNKTQVIFKYPLQITDLQVVTMPEGAAILSVGVQHGVLNLWAIHDREWDLLSKRTIEIIGTGNSIITKNPITRVFLGTVQMPPFVWHVFERIEE